MTFAQSSGTSSPTLETNRERSALLLGIQQQEAFDRVKRLVTSTPVLKFYNVTEEVTLHCDAFDKGLGVTLLQNGQPVAFVSRALSRVEQSYAQIEKECLAILFATE